VNKTPTRLGLWTLALVLATAGAAAAQTVTYDYDRSADFSMYKTYRWVDIEGAERPNQLTDDAIKSAIDSNLASKGLTRTEGDDADLLVAYQVSVTQERQIHSYSYGGYGWGGWGGYGGYGMGDTSISTSTINVGTLVLDVYDPAKKQLVWRGQATKSLNPSKDPDKNRKKIQKAMDKLLKNYPPGATG
jgi:hypothetical protein